MHSNDKHGRKATLHSFADLAGHRKPYRAGVSFGRCVVALIASLAVATLYALLTRYAVEHKMFHEAIGALPWWSVPIAANVFGLLAGIATLALSRPTVAQKQQKPETKRAA